MPASEFDKRVAAVQNVLIPEAERFAGHPLLPTERYTITKLIRESLREPDDRIKVAQLKEWVTPKVRSSFTEGGVITSAASHLLEQAPTAAPPAPKGLLEDELTKARRLIAEADAKPKNALVEESVKAELPYWRRVAREQLGVHLTLEQDRDLEETLRQRLAGTAKVTNIGESLMARGRHKSPFFRAPATVAQVSKNAGTLPDEAEMAAIARMPLLEGAEAFRAALERFPLSLGGKRS
jgi:hypothetical protein